MATLKQIRANRLNAQKCTGPSSTEGKARSSFNALKSGIQAESEVLPWEDPDERAALRAEYHNYHQPRTPAERASVDNLAHGEFLFRRFRRAEVKIVVSKIPDGADLPEGIDVNDDAVIGQAYADASSELGRLQRRMDATNRAFHRDLDQLRLLQAERPPFETPPLVLVPSQPEPPPAEPAAPEPDPPAPSPEPPADVPPDAPPDAPAPAAEAADEPANTPSPAPAPQGPVVVLVGLNRIVSALSKNRTPTTPGGSPRGPYRMPC